MSTLYLIRHGKTEANEQHLYCGSTDLSLSDTGRAELGQLHYEISGVRYCTSGMKRTNETLKILFGDVKFQGDSRFREVNFGDFEMKSYEQLKNQPDYQLWLTGDNMENIPPNGESGRQMEKRILEALPDLQTEDTVLICHGGVIAALMEALFPQEHKNRYQWQPLPGHGYRIENGTWQSIPE